MIFSAGLSPAWQQILNFNKVDRGEVNRAQSSQWCASGKVINVAVAARNLGEQVSMLSTRGGFTGDAISKEIDSYEIQADWIEVEAPTRVCTTILEADGTTTELVENTGSVTDSVLDEFVEKFRIYSQVADVTVLTGSLPDNAPEDYYSRLIRNLPGQFLLDIRGAGLLQTLPFTPFLVKPNLEELEQTVNRSLTDEESILDAMQTLNRMGAQWVVVSNGPGSVLVSSLEEAWRLSPPETEVVNPIGCGDCLAAGIAVATARDISVPNAVKIGIAGATVNARQILPSKVYWEESAEIAACIPSVQI